MTKMKLTFFAIFLIQILQTSCFVQEITIDKTSISFNGNNREYGFQFSFDFEAFPDNIDSSDYFILSGVKVTVGSTEKTVDCQYDGGHEFDCVGTNIEYTAGSDKLIFKKDETGYEVDYFVDFDEKGKIKVKVLEADIEYTLSNTYTQKSECDLGFLPGKCSTCGYSDETKTHCASCFLSHYYGLSSKNKTQCFPKCQEFDYDDSSEDRIDPTSIKSGTCETCGKIGDAVFECVKCYLKTDYLLDGKCVPNCLSEVKGCSQCNETNQTVCIDCVEGYELEDNTCEKLSSITFMKMGLFSFLLMALML